MKDTLETNLPEEAGKLEETKKPVETPEIDATADVEANDTAEADAAIAAGKLTKEEILAKLTELVETSVETSRGEVEALKQAYYKIRRNEVEELKKSLEVSRLEQMARKYEVLGKKPEKLALKLYDMKKSSTYYDDYVALLDEMAETLESSGLFKELGSDRSADGADLKAIVSEIMKADPNITREEAICKAYEDHPELDPFTGMSS